MYKVPQLPLEFIRTQSAPPEGKEGELGALRNKVNLSNQQQVANLNKEKKLSLKSQEFFQTAATTSANNNNNTTTPVTTNVTNQPVTNPQPVANLQNLEQNVMKNIEKFNQKQAATGTPQTQPIETNAPISKLKSKKLNPSASSFTLPGNTVPITEPVGPKSDWDIKDIPKMTPAIPTKTFTAKRPILPVKNEIKKSEDGDKKINLSSGLEKIEEEAKKEDEHHKELMAKEAKEKELKEKEAREKEASEKEARERELREKEERELKEKLEKEQLEKERLEKERIEKETLEKERLDKERLEKEKLDNELKEKEARNHGYSVTQKNAAKITKQYLIDLIENGRRSNSQVPEYLKLICNREVLVESFTSRRTNNTMGGNKPKPNPRISSGNEMTLGSGIKDKERENTSTISPDDKIVRNAIDPKSQEIKKQLNAWTKAQKKDDPLKLLENEVRSNLNKLTPDNFNKIRDKILELAKPSIENVEIIVQKIIEKAWIEPKYIETYAQLCNFMQADKSLIFPDENPSENAKKNKNNAFKSKLLKKIQLAFETEEVTAQKQKEKFVKMTPEEKEMFKKNKMNKILGNVKFIGELYLNKVIPQKVIHICSCSMFEKFQKEYFKAISESDTVSDDFEYNLEGIIKLYDRVGKSYDKDPEKEMTGEEKALIEELKSQFEELETQKSKSAEFKSIFNAADKVTTNGIFVLLDYVKNNVKLPTKRISTLIDNLTDRRNSGWKDKLLSKEGPKTIHELHEEYFKEIEEIEKRHENDDPYDNRYSGSSRGGGGSKVVYYEKKTSMPLDKKGNPKPVFEVYGEKKLEKIEEEKREYNPDKKMKLDFSMDRSKNTTKNILKDSKMSKGETENSVKSIFKKLSEKRDDDKEGDYSEKNAYDDLLALTSKANHSDIFSRFLHDYYDCSPFDVEKRVNIPFKLVTEGGMKKEDFSKEFSLSLSKIWTNVCDFPHLLSSMAKIFFEFVKCDMVKYQDIEIDWTGGADKISEETTEEIQFVLKDFVVDSCKILKEKGMFEKKEEEIKSFLTKVNIEDIMAWYEKMKKNL